MKTPEESVSEERLKQILDVMEDGVYLIGEDLTVEYTNRAMARFEEGGAAGSHCYRVIFGRDAVCPWCRAREVFDGHEIQWEHHVPEIGRTFDITEVPIRNPDGSRSKLSVYRDVTRRKQREKTLKTSREDYERLFEHVGAGVYISSKEGKFLKANQALIDMLGYDSSGEFLSMDIAEDLYMHPEDRREFQELIERDGRVIDYEVEFKRKDGTPLPALLTSHVRKDQQGRVLGYEGIIADQSHRKKMEWNLKEAHHFLNMIIHNSPNAIMATNMQGDILLWNNAAEETLGYSADEVIGKMNIRAIYPEGTAREVMKMMRSPEYGGVGRLRSYPMVYVRQDGEIIEGNLSSAILYGPSGEELASVGIFVDLKERLDMERNLREVQEKLLQSEKLAAMGRLTSQIAHELNNPLYGIMNTLELLKSEIPQESKRRRILEMALSETERLTELLRKMLSFSKPDEEEKQPTDMNTILDEILLLVKKQLQEHGIRVTASFQKELPLVNASRNQLRQVFLNLIGNARDAMPDGGTLNVTTSSTSDRVRIEIEDDGIGVREENLGRIFDAFFTTKDSIKDVGLGLSVCYGFIEEHGGDIRVRSRHGEGTTFTILLPAVSG
ncbi:MAG: PAS domain S-box protein [Deltaproteobacteria bacterium]|nr:PAS domain S-box protein [Deltaproteobacteria bacterium]